VDTQPLEYDDLQHLLRPYAIEIGLSRSLSFDDFTPQGWIFICSVFVHQIDILYKIPRLRHIAIRPAPASIRAIESDLKTIDDMVSKSISPHSYIASPSALDRAGITLEKADFMAAPSEQNDRRLRFQRWWLDSALPSLPAYRMELPRY